MNEWDTKTGELRRTLARHGGAVCALAMAPKGKQIVSGGIDGTLRLWDLTTGKEAWQAAVHKGAVTTLAFAPDGKTLVSAGYDSTVRLLDVLAGRELRKLFTVKLGGWVKAAYSPDGRTLATVGYRDNIRLWKTTDWSELRQFSEPSDAGICFSPDGRFLLGGGQTRRLDLWEVETGKLLPQSSMSDAVVQSLAFEPKGKRFVVGCSFGLAELRDAMTGKREAALEGHFGSVNAVAFSPDGKLLATGGEDGVIRLFDTSTGQQVRRPEGHQARVSALLVTSDGKTLISGGWDRTVRLWELPTGKQIRAHTWERGKEAWQTQATVCSVTISGDNKRVAASTYSGLVLIWEVETGRRVSAVERDQPGAGAIVLNGNGSELLLGGMDGALGFWDANTGKGLRTFDNKGAVRRLALSPDGKLFVCLVSTDPLELGLRSTKDGELVARLPLATDERLGKQFDPEVFFSFSGNGKVLAVGREDRAGRLTKPLRIFDVTTGKELLSFGDAAWVTAVTLSADGKVVAAGSGDGTIDLWDAATGERKERFRTDQWIVRDLVFSPDGSWLFSCGDNGTVCGWKLRR